MDDLMDALLVEKLVVVLDAIEADLKVEMMVSWLAVRKVELVCY